MIYTKKKNLSRYLGQSASLDAAIRAVLALEPEKLSMGRNEIDGDAECLTKTCEKPEEDFVGFTGDVQNWFHMTPEDVLIVYPEDIHMVKVSDPEQCRVKKCCFKFKV